MASIASIVGGGGRAVDVFGSLGRRRGFAPTAARVVLRVGGFVFFSDITQYISNIKLFPPYAPANTAHVG